MEGGVLFIDGKRTYKLNGEDSERVISQKFKIGQNYNPDNIEATIEDGILTVFVANYKKTDKKKRISLL
jgi:HSP20 family molecular chaperone IbpA